jgi:hypothetical protein
VRIFFEKNEKDRRFGGLFYAHKCAKAAGLTCSFCNKKRGEEK